MNKRAIERLLKVLEVERKALLSGDLEAVGALTAEKEALDSTFEGVPARDLKAVSAALARNGVLLAAARDGVTTVLDTLRKQRAARSTLSSYDRSGKATTIAQTKSGTERRF